MIGVGLAWAAVSVVDGSGCVELERVQLELGVLLGEDVLRRLDVEVVREADVLTLTVADAGRPLWLRRLVVEEVDCPVVADLLARSVAQGLAELPDWQFSARRRSTDLSVALGSGWGVGAPPRWSLLGGGSVPLGGRARWGLGADLSVSPLRLEDGVGGDVWQVAAGTGPQLDVGRRHLARMEALLHLGGGRVVPRPDGLEVDMGWVPAAAGSAGVVWVNPSPARVGFGVRVPLNRIALGWQGQEVLEPAVRAQLWLGIGGAVVR